MLRFIPDFLAGFVEFLSRLAALIPVIDIRLGYFAGLVSESLTIHAPVVLGILALCILWTTYSDKIVSVPSTGTLAGLSPLPRLIFNGLDLLFRLVPRAKLSEATLARLVYWQAQAALVAIDMLALATLLKSMQLLDQWNVSLVVCGIVFVCVGAMATLAGIQKLPNLRRLAS